MNASKYMKIIDRIVVGQDRYILIVQIGSKHFLLGVSASGIQMLSEVEKDDFICLKEESGIHPLAKNNFKEILQQFRNNKKD